MVCASMKQPLTYKLLYWKFKAILNERAVVRAEKNAA